MSEWIEYVDEDGQTYYYNNDNGMSQWAKPSAMVDKPKSTVSDFVQKQFTKARRRSITEVVDSEWTHHTDPDTGKIFFHNETTGVSQYTDPHEDTGGPQSFVQEEFARKRRSSVVEKVDDVWEVHTDLNTNSIFYHNRTTGLSMWTIPDNAPKEQMALMEAAFEQAEFSQKRRSSVTTTLDDVWEQHTDTSTGQVFFHNHKTGVSSWEMPQTTDASNATTMVDCSGGLMFQIRGAPEMFPVGFKKMVNDPSNHRLLVREGIDLPDTRIAVIGSGFHVAVALTPLPSGVTPDIKGDFNSNDAQGKITFATINDICVSVERATSVKIRKNPLDEEEKKAQGDTAALAAIQVKRTIQLDEYKRSFILWLQSLSTSHETTLVTFVRNVYPMNAATGQYVEKSAKPVWCTGLGVDVCLDCGSGKVALVDGVLGTQLQTGETLKWDTESAWTTEQMNNSMKKLKMIVEEQGGGSNGRKIIAYGTGNWRKPHMETTWPEFQASLMKINVDFNLLPGELEAKYGGISTLKLIAPYAPECMNWIVMEMGGGSTQITRFSKVEKTTKRKMGKQSGVQEFVQNEFAKVRRRSIVTEELDAEWTKHVDPKDGQEFYHNEKTGVSQYAVPDIAATSNLEKSVVSGVQEFVQNEFAKKRRTSVSENIAGTEWTAHKDATSNSVFYHNERTGLSTWHMPEGVTVTTTVTDEDADADAEDADAEYDTQEDQYAEDADDDDQVPDTANADLMADLLTRMRSLEFENKKWKAHAFKMETRMRSLHEGGLALQQNERGLRAEIQSLEHAAWQWKERAVSAERALLGFYPVEQKVPQSDYRTQRNWW